MAWARLLLPYQRPSLAAERLLPRWLLGRLQSCLLLLLLGLPFLLQLQLLPMLHLS